MIIHSLEWKDNKLYLLDQTRLPGTYVYLEYSDYLKVADAIKKSCRKGSSRYWYSRCLWNAAGLSEFIKRLSRYRHN